MIGVVVVVFYADCMFSTVMPAVCGSAFSSADQGREIYEAGARAPTEPAGLNPIAVFETRLPWLSIAFFFFLRTHQLFTECHQIRGGGASHRESVMSERKRWRQFAKKSYLKIIFITGCLVFGIF